MLQSTEQKVNDGLNNLVTSGKTLASNLMNDPVVQWATSDKGSLTTAPLPAQREPSYGLEENLPLVAVSKSEAVPPGRIVAGKMGERMPE